MCVICILGIPNDYISTTGNTNVNCNVFQNVH